MWVYLTNRFQVAVHLFSYRSQMTSKCGKNKKVAHEAQPSVSLMFLPHFDVLCDRLLNRRTAPWNLFVLYNKKQRAKILMMTSSIHLSSNRSCENQSECVHNWAYFIYKYIYIYIYIYIYKYINIYIYIYIYIHTYIQTNPYLWWVV